MPVSFSAPFARMSNGATQDDHCFVATTTGFFAVENSAGELEIYQAGRPQIIPASETVSLWSCAGSSDPAPSGDITALSCHDLGLTLLEVHGLACLKALNCCRNLLTELNLTGLTALENLYCHQNPFVHLDLSPCHSLKFVGYASRYFGYSDTAIASLHESCAFNAASLITFLPKPASGIIDTANDTVCAEKYISPRTRAITTEESLIRDVAYALKEANPEAIEVPAPAMAALITGPCWLVPIPASNASLVANLALARAIAAIFPGARVKIAIERTQPVESSTQLRRAGKYGLEPEEHHFVQTGNPLSPLPLFFVDNVITTRNTIRAARAVLGWGTGLAYADASSPFNNHRRRAAKPTPQVEIRHD